MKNLHILYYTAAVLFAIAAIMSFVNGGLFYGGISIIFSVALYLVGSSHATKEK